MTDVESHVNILGLGNKPGGGAVRAYLDPEIAGEGVKVILSDGSEATYNPPPAKPIIPDISNVKAIRHYFGRTDYHFFPTWLYHPSRPAAIAKNAEEAWEKFGIRLLERTDIEQRQFGGGKYRWEMTKEWSTLPYDLPKFDPQNPGHGKNYMPATPNPRVAQNELLAELIPTVTAAVVTALKSSGQANAPANVDQNEWDEFLAFQAFKKTQKSLDDMERQSGGALNAGKPDEEREAWEAKAREIGMRIDGRWSTETLREKVGAELDRQATGTSGEAA